MLAAAVLEPLLQGAGGMLLVDPLFQRAMVQVRFKLGLWHCWGGCHSAIVQCWGCCYHCCCCCCSVLLQGAGVCCPQKEGMRRR